MFLSAEDEQVGEREAPCPSWRSQRKDHRIGSWKTKKSGKKKEEEKLNALSHKIRRWVLNNGHVTVVSPASRCLKACYSDLTCICNKKLTKKLWFKFLRQANEVCYCAPSHWCPTFMNLPIQFSLDSDKQVKPFFRVVKIKVKKKQWFNM